MKTPTQEQFDKVINNLITAYEISKHDAPVDMYNTEAFTTNHKHLCGTPMCHAGWYASIALKGKRVDSSGLPINYLDGASIMSKHLGFASGGDLEFWAKNNPEIWGNENGRMIFTSAYAFNYKGELDLLAIINHWQAVKERAAKLN